MGARVASSPLRAWQSLRLEMTRVLTEECCSGPRVASGALLTAAWPPQMADFPLLEELEAVLFLSSIWAFEVFFSRVLGASPLLGQMLCGIILGPALLNIVPFVDAFIFLGRLGSE